MKNKLFIIIFFSFIFFQQNIFSENIIINGKTLNNKTSISNIHILFIDKADKIFRTTSDSNGEFSIALPKNEYSINIEKAFYRISEENLKNYIFKNNISLNINIKKSSSFLDGFIVDKNEKPIKNAKLIIKNGRFSSKIFSNENGKFSTYLNPGIFTLSISKYGYAETAFIRKIDNNSAIINEKIKLRASEFFLKGTITDGVQALSNIQISLHNEFFKKINSTISDKDGFFYFYNIPLEENFFLLINDKRYKTYRSESFKFNKKIKNKIIFLEKK